MRTAATGAEGARLGHAALVGELRQLFLDKLKIRVEDAAADLIETGLLDSLTLVRLILDIEERFGVPLPMGELGIESFRTLVKIAELIASRRLPAGTGSPDRHSLAEAIRSLILERLSLKVDSSDSDLFQMGLLDSMLLVQLIAALEERFCVQLPIEELELNSFRSLAEIASLVASRGGLPRTNPESN